MNKKILLFGFVMLMLASVVSATLDDAIMWIAPNGNDVKDFVGDAITNNGVSISGGYMIWDGTSDYITPISVNRPTGSIAFCFNPQYAQNDEAYHMIIGDLNLANNVGRVSFAKSNDNLYHTIIGDNSGTIQADITFDDSYIPYNSDSKIVITYTTDGVYTYVNNVLRGSDTSATMPTTDPTNKQIGAFLAGSYYSAMKAGYIAYYDRVLTSGEIADLNSQDCLYNPYYIPSVFELTASNLYNSSAITDFNVSLTNSSGTYDVATTNGTIYGVYNQLVNLTIISENYFDRTYLNWNTSNNLDAEIWQAYINIITTNLANTTQYTDVWYQINHTGTGITATEYINDGVTTITTFNVTSGTYNILANKTGYPFGNASITINPLENKTVYIPIGFFAQLNLYDEVTMLPFNISNANSTKVIIVCQDIGSYEHQITNSTTNVSIACTYDKLRFSVQFDDTTYSRVLLSSETDIFSQDVYLIDLTTTQAIYNAFLVNDYVGEYTNPKIYIKKNMEGKQVVIHSDDLDVENKISVYLIENDQYTLELHSDNNPINVLGFYGADIAGTKEITVTSANIDVGAPADVGNGVIIYTYAKNVSLDTYAYAIFNDTTSYTTFLSWSLWVLNETDKTLTEFYTANATGLFGEAVFTPYNITNQTNNTVISSITYTQNGVQYTYYKQITSQSEDISKTNLFGYYSAAIIQWGVIIFLSVIALSGTITTQNYVNYIIIGGAAMSMIFGLFSISVVLLMLALVIAFMFQIKSSDDTRISR